LMCACRCCRFCCCAGALSCTASHVHAAGRTSGSPAEQAVRASARHALLRGQQRGYQRKHGLPVNDLWSRPPARAWHAPRKSGGSRFSNRRAPEQH
jgi:hypothetical protein